MRKSLLCKVIPLALFFMMIASALTFAQEGDGFKIQGLIMNLDLWKKMMIVNERTFTWDQNTKFYDEKGSPITVDKLRVKTWVYIVGTRDSAKGRVNGEKIYLLGFDAPFQSDRKHDDQVWSEQRRSRTDHVTESP